MRRTRLAIRAQRVRCHLCRVTFQAPDAQEHEASAAHQRHRQNFALEVACARVIPPCPRCVGRIYPEMLRPAGVVL